MMPDRAREDNAFVVPINLFNTLVANPASEIMVHNVMRHNKGIVYACRDSGSAAPWSTAGLNLTKDLAG